MNIPTAFVLAAAALACANAGRAWSAAPGDRTSMPDACSERTANCVIEDGPPQQRAEPATRDAPLSLRPTVTPLPTGPLSPRGARPADSPGDAISPARGRGR